MCVGGLICGNTTITQYYELLQQRFEKEAKKGAARARQTSITQYFDTGRYYPGTERETVQLGNIITVTNLGESDVWFGLCVNVKRELTHILKTAESRFIKLLYKELVLAKPAWVLLGISK